MKTLARNDNNDMFARSGSLAFSEGTECYADIATAEINTHRGELQFDERHGVDYFGTIFESPRLAGVCIGQISAVITKLPWVKGIKKKTYNANTKVGILEWSMTVETKTGEEFIVGSFKKGNNSVIGIRWEDIIDKPNGIDKVSDRVSRIMEISGETLERGDTTEKVKEVVNNIVETVKSAREI